jgi:hypothetical protein
MGTGWAGCPFKLFAMSDLGHYLTNALYLITAMVDASMTARRA